MSKMKKTNITPKTRTKKSTKKATVLHEGDLTINNTQKIKKEMLSVMNKFKNINIIVKNVDDLDLSYIQLLYSFYKTALDKRKTVALDMELPDDIKMIVRNSGFDSVFDEMNENNKAI